MVAVFSWLENDLHRDSLDDFDVVAGGVFRRQQTEGWAGGPGDAVDVAVQNSTAGVDMNPGFLTNAHVPQLGFLEVGSDPDIIKRHNGEQLLPGLDIQAD